MSLENYRGLTKEELLRELERLQGGADLAAMHELRVHQEELRVQNEQLREMQHWLEQSRDRYVELFDSAPFGYLTLDHIGAIDEVNLAFARMLETDRAKLHGRLLRQFVAQSNWAELNTLIFLTQAEERVTRTAEIAFEAPNGKQTRARMTMKRTAPDVIQVTVNDLSEVDDMDRRRRDLERREAIALASNEAKDRFLAMLSHELRTPLTPILATVSALEAEKQMPESTRPLLEMIRRNLDAETRLIDDLLDVTRVTHGKLRIERSTIDLHRIARDAAERTPDSKPPVLLELEATEHHVLGDRSRFDQVLWNLIGNALRFTPPTGSIRIRTDNPTLGRVRLSVIDDGLGLEPDLLPRLFVPFQQAERRKGSLGLGLAICKGIVEAHGGKITASSEGPQKGATFEIELETVAAPLSNEVPAPPPLAVIPPRLRIFLVEDHVDSAASLVLLMRAHGFETRVAGSIAQALAVKDFDPEVLISDLDLPDGSGLELLRRLRGSRPLPALVLSGYGSPDDLRRSKHAGFYEHLVKPVHFEHLLAAIARVCASAGVRSAAAGAGES
jgi:PAS domain S-box-containing protein